MVCYRCGSALSEKDFCTSCGADVGMYKKLLALSNRYYNDALEKCNVRDLSGAILALRQSIKLNKNNVDAHNLLGLVYYEIGEIGEALGQWVISSNIRDNKNIALDYIKLMQDNPSMLESMDANIKKFNYALGLCQQDSLDIAVIQLKNILSSPHKYLKAHQLLALLYIKNEEWELAQKEVDRCEAIDVGSTIIRRYKHEIEKVLEPSEQQVKANTKKVKKDNTGVQVYKSGNDTIIQPVYKNQSGAGSVLLNIGLGLIIGVAITYFLILPSKIYKVNETANEKIATISDEKDKKTSELEALQIEYDKLSNELEETSANIATEGSGKIADGLMLAVSAYNNDPNDIESIALALESVEAAEEENEDAQRSTAFNQLYEYLMNNKSVELSSYYFEKGFESFNNEEYEAAVPNLRRAYRYNESNGDALFYLATSLRRSGDESTAKELYAEVMDRFPGTERATRAETYLAEMNNQE